VAADLSDDRVANIVRDELERAQFQGKLELCDWAVSADAGSTARSPADGWKDPAMIDPMDAPGDLPLPLGCYRLGMVKLEEHVDLHDPSVSRQIGQTLWPLLDSDRQGGVPTDFVDRHLSVDKECVRIWSRAGIISAHKPSGEQRSGNLRNRFIRLVQLTSDVREFTVSRQTSTTGSRNSAALQVGSDLLRRMADMKRELALPDNRTLRRFFDASRLSEVLRTVSDINAAQHLHGNMQEVTHVQKIIHLIEYLVGAAYSAELWALLSGHKHGDSSLGVLVASLVGVGAVEVMNRMVMGHWPIYEAVRHALTAFWQRHR
jgi:hypothetical protein